MNNISVEALGAMHYFYSFVHEPLIRCVITFSGHIDEAVLKKAVDLSAEAVPAVKSRFEIKKDRPCWRHKNFTADDIVQTVKADPEIIGQPEKLAASIIDFFSGPQVKIYLLRYESSDTLIVIVNHMVCDGTGFKEYLYLLARLYSQIYNNGGYTENFRVTERSLSRLLKSFTFKEKLEILLSKPSLGKQKNDIAIPFQGDKSSPFIETHRLQREVFTQAKAFAKNNHASLNDIFLTAYTRIINMETGINRVILPCPVDLRRFITSSNPPGICNLTSNLICDVTLASGESFMQTLKKVSGEMKSQKSDKSCVKPVMILGAAYRIFSFAHLQKFFAKSFTLPVVSYTNLGIIEKSRLSFEKAEVLDAYLTGAVKYVPYFQISVSSFDGTCTLSCNMYGTEEDRAKIKSLLSSFENEISENIIL